MAKKIIWMGMLVMVLAFGMAVVGCDDGSTNENENGNGGVFTLTGIPEKYNGKYAYVQAWNEEANPEDESEFIWGGQSIDMATEALKFSQISNGRVSIPMWILVEEYTVKRYTGNDTVFVGFGLQEYYDNDDGYLGWLIFESVTFSNGNATKSWNDGREADCSCCPPPEGFGKDY